AVDQEQCAEWHGARARGDGAKATHLQGPPPASLADREGMSTVSPVDVYRKLTIGVAGTAMPQFEETLSPEDRWAAATYVATLRADEGLVREGEGRYATTCASCHGATGGGDGPLAATLSIRPPAPRDLAVQGRFTDRELEGLILRGRPGTAMPGFARTLDPGDAAGGRPAPARTSWGRSTPGCSRIWSAPSGSSPTRARAPACSRNRSCCCCGKASRRSSSSRRSWRFSRRPAPSSAGVTSREAPGPRSPRAPPPPL